MNRAIGTEFAKRIGDKGRQRNMAEDSKEKIEVDTPRKPLEPVGDGVGDAQKGIYAQLLAEYGRIKEIHSNQLEGVSWTVDKEKKVYTIEEYKSLLASYKVARAEYNRRFADSIETIDMVREKLEQMSEEDDEYEKEHPDVEIPDVPEMEDVPDEPWEDFKKRFEEYNKKIHEWEKQLAKSNEKTSHMTERLKIRLEEIAKFPQLEYELEMRLRHTYIDPKTGENLYRPDDEVGEGLICVGSRDYTPVLKDE